MTCLPDIVRSAIKTQIGFTYRDWRSVPFAELTRAERCMAFVERYLRIPDGPDVGKPMHLYPFQEAIFYQAVDTDCWQVVFSSGRKNSKTATMAALALCYIIGPEAELNSSIVSAANSRDQAAHLYSYMAKMLGLNLQLVGKYKLRESAKAIHGTAKNVEFKALSADAKNQYGGNHRIVLVDELGQTVGPISPLYDSLVTGQGGQAHPKMLILSTQAANDGDLLSVIIDTAINENDGRVAVHLYTADPGCELNDGIQWKMANPAPFRSVEDIRRQAKEAVAMPVTESRFRNLILNQRVTTNNIFIPAARWKALRGAPATTDELNYYPLHIGLDLSKRIDLTAAVAAFMRDTGEVVLHPFVFIPADGLAEREQTDRAPYRMWVEQGYLIAVPGKTISYDWVAQYLALHLKNSFIQSIHFDRWGIENFKEAALREDLNTATWVPVGQGYRDFSPRLDAFEQLIIDETLAHGNHPLLTMAAVNAIATSDPAGNRKIDKSRTSARIDPLVAAVMAAYPLLDGKRAAFDSNSMVG